MPDSRKVQKSTSDISHPSPQPRNIIKQNINPLHPAPKKEKRRKSISNAQDECVSKKVMTLHAKKAHKKATLLYDTEQKKAEGNLSAKKGVRDCTEGLRNCTKHTYHPVVCEGWVGWSVSNKEGP